jgi:hypothetical protein
MQPIDKKVNLKYKLFLFNKFKSKTMELKSFSLKSTEKKESFNEFYFGGKYSLDVDNSICSSCISCDCSCSSCYCYINQDSDSDISIPNIGQK